MSADHYHQRVKHRAEQLMRIGYSEPDAWSEAHREIQDDDIREMEDDWR